MGDVLYIDNAEDFEVDEGDRKFFFVKNLLFIQCFINSMIPGLNF
jgi:hypothetical protein